MQAIIGEDRLFQIKFDLVCEHDDSHRHLLFGRLEYRVGDFVISAWKQPWNIYFELAIGIERITHAKFDKGYSLTSLDLPKENWFDIFRIPEVFQRQSVEKRLYFIDMLYGAAKRSPFFEIEVNAAVYDLPWNGRSFPRPLMDYPNRVANLIGPYIYEYNGSDHILWSTQNLEVFEVVLQAGYVDAVIVKTAILLSTEFSGHKLFPETNVLALRQPLAKHLNFIPVTPIN